MNRNISKYLAQLLHQARLLKLYHELNGDVKFLLKNNNTKNLTSEEKLKIQNFWKKYSKKKIDIRWHRYYSKFKEFDERYISEPFFYGILDYKANAPRNVIKAYEDKNYYDLFYPNFDKPNILLKNINGIFYDSCRKILEKEELIKYLNNLNGEYIIKPSLDSTGGNNVRKIKITKNQILMDRKIIDWKTVFDIYKKDFLIQELVRQSKEISSIYPNSLNTIRLSTFRSGNEFDILSVVIRIGTNGAEVDNFSKGGFAVGVNKNTGLLNNYGVNKYGDIIDRFHPETNYEFADFQIPNWENVIEKVKEWCFSIPDYVKLCAWDIGLNESNEPIFIECNLFRQDINMLQVNNGPLFGDKTEYYLKKLLND